MFFSLLEFSQKQIHQRKLWCFFQIYGTVLLGSLPLSPSPVSPHPLLAERG